MKNGGMKSVAWGAKTGCIGLRVAGCGIFLVMDERNFKVQFDGGPLFSPSQCDSTIEIHLLLLSTGAILGLLCKSTAVLSSPIHSVIPFIGSDSTERLQAFDKIPQSKLNTGRV
ncbi:hypothetical protein L2E82_31216 [Cichorium intybus]|uniref:Uncharacterized protein n=1 Tax=Cichorium intybus TaxID=13427 RepID=A0ACB9D2Q5_CICIN|nr:hypothetical protein L2E82_31216 [Cichorium intybus]